MQAKPPLWLMLALLMFPQIVETIYSPALGSISQAFSVSYPAASQTLSVYFVAFAMGVAVWGILADKWGRRPAMLTGLFIYGVSAMVAMQTANFAILMAARACSAFGIAVGSIVTQTMLRDSFTGEELGKVFSVMGVGMAISPVIGMFSGGQLVQTGGHEMVFLALFIMALGLFVCCLAGLPETQTNRQVLQLATLSQRMLRDLQIWRSAMLVCLYNIVLFSYYQLGGFHFAGLGLTPDQFGYSGLVLGLGSLIGSYINKILLSRKTTQDKLLQGAAVLLMLGAVTVFLILDTIWFLAPMILIVMAFGIAIPNVLSMALSQYRSQAGSAGALFGLIYYLFIGGGLALAGVAQNLGLVLITCASVVFLVTFIQK
ncbi:multidrug effflux MFS transporter [Oceanimonas baumannii]|uniref:multidrug effflux MFS transporter n=1 Tax=Oceanimonas baumannii TaxID=129578 RepID=UPI003A932876